MTGHRTGQETEIEFSGYHFRQVGTKIKSFGKKISKCTIPGSQVKKLNKNPYSRIFKIISLNNDYSVIKTLSK